MATVATKGVSSTSSLLSLLWCAPVFSLHGFFPPGAQSLFGRACVWPRGSNILDGAYRPPPHHTSSAVSSVHHIILCSFWICDVLQSLLPRYIPEYIMACYNLKNVTTFRFALFPLLVQYFSSQNKNNCTNEFIVFLLEYIKQKTCRTSSSQQQQQQQQKRVAAKILWKS
jgi:hypothetical protein